MQEVDDLREEFSRYEKLGRLLAKLDKLKHGGGVDATQYTQLKADYESRSAASVEKMKQMRANLKAERVGLTSRLTSLEARIHDLTVRGKTGELDADDLGIQLGPFESERASLAQSLKSVNTALTARSSADLGGYVDPDGEAHTDAISVVQGDRQSVLDDALGQIGVPNSSPYSIPLPEVPPSTSSIRSEKRNYLVIGVRVVLVLWLLVLSAFAAEMLYRH